MKVLVVDGANVVGSKPDGWWRDRAGAAARLHGRLAVSDRDDLASYDEIVLVLEGQARGGVAPGRDGHVRTVHAMRDGDATVAVEVAAARERDDVVTVVSADRALVMRVEGLGAGVRGPGWLTEVAGY